MRLKGVEGIEGVAAVEAATTAMNMRDTTSGISRDGGGGDGGDGRVRAASEQPDEHPEVFALITRALAGMFFVGPSLFEAMHAVVACFREETFKASNGSRLGGLRGGVACRASGSRSLRSSGLGIDRLASIGLKHTDEESV